MTPLIIQFLLNRLENVVGVKGWPSSNSGLICLFVDVDQFVNVNGAFSMHTIKMH